VAVVALGIGVLLVANGGLGKVAGAIGSSFNGLVADLTKTPAPSAADLLVADAPTLEAPDEPYTNQPSVDLTGTVPAAVVGQAETKIRIYLTLGGANRGVAIEVPVGTSQHFLVPGLTLSKGTNTFTATIVGPTDLESESSPAVSYILDTTKPKITISSPKASAVVNAKTVQVVGKTQARSTLSIRNVTTSFYQVRRSALPESVRLLVTVTDPDGRALSGASVTFTLAVPGVPAIASSTLKTASNGRASFTTTIPKGATAGQCSVTVIVHTTDLGDTTDRTVITIRK
jgi:hypothetical protein